MTKKKKTEEKKENIAEAICKDKKCPFHGSLKTRGRVFQGRVTRKFAKRIAIEFERTVYVLKFERYKKRKTRIHARVPECLEEVKIGDYVEVRECRPLSKIIHFVLTKIIKKAEDEQARGEGK